MGVPEVRGMAKVCRNFKRFLVAQRITCKILIRAFCFPTSLKIAQWFSAVKSCSIRCLSSYYSEWCHTYHYALNLLLLLYILYIFKCVYTVEDKCTQMLHSYSQNIFWSCLFVNMYRKVTHTTDHDTRCYSVHVIIIFSCIVSYMWFTILPYDILHVSLNVFSTGMDWSVYSGTTATDWRGDSDRIFLKTSRKRHWETMKRVMKVIFFSLLLFVCFGEHY